MTELLSSAGTNPTDTLIAGTYETFQAKILSGTAAALTVRGSVIAFDISEEAWVPYVGDSGATDVGTARGVLNEDVDASAAAVYGEAIHEGELIASGLSGIDWVVPTTDMVTPTVPTGALVAGGSLAATTAHKYKVTAVDVNGGITAPSTVLTATTLAAAAGVAAGLVVANIGAVNTLLGDCTGTAKSVQFTVDGVSVYATFALDYSGAGALGNHAALITALELTAPGVTATSSDGAAVTLTSDTTGAASIILVTADTTGLFLAPTYTAGVAESETITVTVPEVAGAEDYKVWRSVDGGTVYLYRLMTDAEITAGYFTDDGTLTFIAGTPVEVTDLYGVMQLFDRKIMLTGLTAGYQLEV